MHEKNKEITHSFTFFNQKEFISALTVNARYEIRIDQTETMFWLTSITLLIFLGVSSTISIQLNCYLNASLILPSNTILYNNVTIEYCQCLLREEDIYGFLYDNSTNSCYTFGNNSSISNIRISVNSQVCFVNRTIMVR